MGSGAGRWLLAGMTLAAAAVPNVMAVPARASATPSARSQSWGAGRTAGAAEPAPGSISLYPLGDSLTFGASGPYAVTPGGYRGTLAQDLGSLGINVTYTGTSTQNPPVATDVSAYRHDGHPGFRIDQVAADLDHGDPYSGDDGGDWLTGNSQHALERPQVIVLLIGTNDILQSYDPGRSYPGGYNASEPGERSQFVADMANRLWSLLRELARLDPGTRLVICTIPPIGVTTHDATGLAYDDSIRHRVMPESRLFGLKSALADVESSFLAQPSDQPDLIGPDGVHPTPVGYSRMAGVIASAVGAVLRNP